MAVEIVDLNRGRDHRVVHRYDDATGMHLGSRQARVVEITRKIPNDPQEREEVMATVALESGWAVEIAD